MSFQVVFIQTVKDGMKCDFTQTLNRQTKRQTGSVMLSEQQSMAMGGCRQLQIRTPTRGSCYRSEANQMMVWVYAGNSHLEGI